MWQQFGSSLIHFIIFLSNVFAPVISLVQRDVAYGLESINRLDIFRSGDRTVRPVIIFLYGGGWRSGSKEGISFVGAALARKGFVVVIPEFRHFPMASLSDILTDNAAAVAWTISHASEFGGDPLRVVVAGHSSGAWAAVMLALNGEWLEKAGSTPTALAGVIGLSGPYSVSSLTEQKDKDVFTDTGPEMEPVSLQTNHRPSMFLITGASDTDVLPSSTISFSKHRSVTEEHVHIKSYKYLSHSGAIRAMTFPFNLFSSVADDISKFAYDVRSRH